MEVFKFPISNTFPQRGNSACPPAAPTTAVGAGVKGQQELRQPGTSSCCAAKLDPCWQQLFPSHFSELPEMKEMPF